MELTNPRTWIVPKSSVMLIVEEKQSDDSKNKNNSIDLTARIESQHQTNVLINNQLFQNNKSVECKNQFKETRISKIWKSYWISVIIFVVIL